MSAPPAGRITDNTTHCTSTAEPNNGSASMPAVYERSDGDTATSHPKGQSADGILRLQSNFRSRQAQARKEKFAVPGV